MSEAAAGKGEDIGKDRMPPTRVPESGVLLGIDYGTRRIGIAVSTSAQTMAMPLVTLEARDRPALQRQLQRLIEEHRAVGLVVGLPVHMSGDEGAKAAEARQFGAWLRETFDVPVAFFDERLSSAMADDVMLAGGLTRKQRRGRRDRIAAQVILQHFLDRNTADRDCPPGPINS